MLLPPLATIADLVNVLTEPLAEDAIARAEAKLRAASSLVRDEGGKTWMVDGVLDVSETAFTITLEVARRALENPLGLTGETYPEYAWRGHDTEPGVYLTATEAKRLRRASGKSGLWVQPTTRCDPLGGYVFVDDQYGCDPFLVADHY